MEWVSTYAVHSTALIAAVWLLTSVIPKLSLGTREALWKVALLGPLATATVVTTTGLPSIWGPVELPQVLRTESSVAEAAPAAAPPAVEAKPVVERHIVRHRSGDLEITTSRQRKTPAVAAAAAPVATSSASAEPSSWPWVLLGLWGLGAAIALGRLGWAAYRLRKQLEGRRDVIEDPVLESFLDLCSKAELKKRPRLTASPHLRSPIALGRREICLPERAVDSLAPQQQRGMLAHEMAHLLRHDPVWTVVVAVVEAVFFFQPLNHLARRKIQEVAEFQCDDWAAKQTGTGVHLAKCLAEVAGWVEDGPPVSPAVVAMADRGSPIVRRITRLLHERRSGGRVHPAGRVALTLGTLGLVVAAVPAVTQAQTDPSPAPTSTSTPMLARAEATPRPVFFEDHSDEGHDRSRVWLHTDDEVVEIQVQAPRPAPPPPPPPAPSEDRVEIMLFGHLGGCSWLGCDWWGGMFGFGGVEVLIAEPDPFGWTDHLHHHTERALQRAERARERAERARERAERSRERALDRLERARERQVERDFETSWPTIFGVSWEGDGSSDDERGVVIEL